MAAIPSPTTVLRLITAVFLISLATSDDLQSLLSLKSSFDHNTVFDSWNDGTPLCSFKGITCDSNGFVKEIELSSQNLTGNSLPLTPLCDLKSLEKLSLGSNNIYGGVSEELNNCVNLKYLDLGNNFFSGRFPAISSLRDLVTLHSNNSGFSGIFPWDSLKNMSNLQVLSLADNPFEATTRFPSVILNMTKLNWLYLSNCSIAGTIPEEIGNLVELIELEMSQNFLTGEIPNSITRLNKLWQLELYGNNLTGELPVGLGNLTNLEFFDVSNNSLTGNLSEINTILVLDIKSHWSIDVLYFRVLHKSQVPVGDALRSLQLYRNHLTGEIPAEIGDFKNLESLSLYMNDLTGQLPQALGSWADFDFIDVSQNRLTGPIPPDMCKNGAMTKLLLVQNDFSGEIPPSYGNCASLVRVRLTGNSLSGKIPSGMWGLPHLDFLDFGDNNFEGSIAPAIAGAKSLTQLHLANNKFAGALPSEISQASSLAIVELSNNHFAGELPGNIGDLKQLTSLQLQGNKFSGQIPESLSSCKSLNDINMASNSFSGVIPSSLGSIPTLTFLNLSGNQLSGEIPGALSSLRLNLLDLSNNRLTGSVPDSLLSVSQPSSFSGNSGLCSGKIRGFPQCSNNHEKPHHLKTALLLLLVAFLAGLGSVYAFCRLKKKRSLLDERPLRNESWDVKSFHVLTFTEDEVIDSIKQENLIGKGGSGNVYRVTLGGDKIELAVKHIWHEDDGRKMTASSSPMLFRQKGDERRRRKEFEAEVQTLSSIRHINIVKLYCSITSEGSSLLVYEYMPNGSLWDRLHPCNKKFALDWESRYEIALGSAKGLEYLHHGCDKPIIHRDVKSSNILLDEDLRPRIADFGLAKIVQHTDSSNGSTQVVAGTHGYIAPEYAYSNKVDEKSDVYSFGVVLMELVTGKRPIEPEFGENKDVVSWVCSKLRTRDEVMGIVDSEIPEYYVDSAIDVLKVAIRCTARLPTTRPTMRSVVKMLEDAKPYSLLDVVVAKEGSE